MSDALQHAAIAVLVALAALLEARRRRELERTAAEHAQQLRAAALRAQGDDQGDTRCPPQG